jgi:ornithine--oxo-acid transaminase
MGLTEKIIQETEQYSANNYHPLPIVIQKAEGCWVWDVENNKFMDMLSAYSALSHGHRHPKMIQTLKEQADKLTLTSRAFHNELMGRFLKLLVEMCGMEMALPMNTGAEAVETAIKAARKWGYRVKGVADDQAEIIACSNNFHGRTTTIVGFSTEEQYQDGFGPFAPGFKIIPYNSVEDFRKAVTPNTVGFLVEPIQGEGGIIMPDVGYLKAVHDICRENKVLLMADEIQTGLGRTGKLFACEYDGIVPDMYIVGKALGGGIYPVSAVVSSREIMGVFSPGDHGSTFGGNPLAAAIGITALEIIKDEKLTNQAFEKGKYFVEKLREIRSPHVLEVRGRGLLIGVEIKESSGTARPYCEKLMELGILAKETHHQVIRFAPPLIIKKEEIDWALEQIRKVLQ